MKITGRDAIDFIPRSDPASPHYREPAPCSRCKGKGVEPCYECQGKGWYSENDDGTGTRITCTNKGCDNGLRPCARCDGTGRKIS